MRKHLLWMVPVIALIVCFWVAGSLKDRERKLWKEEAVRAIATWSADTNAISKHLSMLSPVARTSGNGSFWIGTNVLLMSNGEYLVYQTRHGRQDVIHPVHNIFLARGSDGKWLYTTYHFCTDMVPIMSDEPPSSIASFAKTYFAREFDGRSDECLQKTWPVNK